MKRLLLVRHGQSAWNAAGRWQGWADIPLSEAGEAEAQAAALRIAEAGLSFAAIAASDLLRARHTAELFGGVPDPVEPRLRERNVGDWSGLTDAEIEARWPGQLAQWRVNALPQCPGGEPHPDFLARILEGVTAVAARIGPGQSMLVVTHGGVIRTIEGYLGLASGRVHNLGGRWLQVDRGQIVAGEAAQL